MRLLECGALVKVCPDGEAVDTGVVIAHGALVVNC